MFFGFLLSDLTIIQLQGPLESTVSGPRADSGSGVLKKKKNGMSVVLETDLGSVRLSGSQLIGFPLWISEEEESIVKVRAPLAPAASVSDLRSE